MAKNDFQKEMSKLMGQVKVGLKRFGKDAGIFAKKGEKELVKASKIGKFQLEIVNLNLQKEKIYYDIGKKIASLRSSKKLSRDSIKSYLDRLRKIETEVRGKKREMSEVKKNAK